MSPNTAEAAALEDRRARVWDLRVAGKTLREIAGVVGVSHVTVWDDCKVISERLNSETMETAAQHRSMQLQRLDKAISVLMPMIDDPDKALEAMDRLDKLEKRRAALLGLDAPTRQEVSGPAGAPIPIDARADLVERLAGLAAAEAAAASAREGSGEPEPGRG